MKKIYINPLSSSIDLSPEMNFLGSNQLPGSGSEKFNDDGEFDWGDNN